MSKERIQHLLQLYAANQASREEVEELFAWLKKQEGDDALKKFIFDTAGKEAHSATLPEKDWDRIWQSVESGITSANTSAKIVRPYWSRVSRGGIAAAVLLLVMAGSAWFYFSRPKPTSAPVVSAVTIKKDIAPGGNKALLTLADGTTIVLDTVQTGLLALQGQTKIIKQNTAQLIYNSPATSEQKAGEVLYNRVTTPHGGQFQLMLPDGTNVWLNAGSSLCFPATFSTSKRMVQLTGEAYFEVASLTPPGGSKKVPFIVKIGTSSGAQGEIEVLGTHFNVNAYDDEEAIKTTLLEGKVKVVKRETVPQGGSKEESGILKPGEQAVLSRAHSPLTIHHSPNVQQVMAWKNGYFRFKETGIRELMRQVERWYNVEVEFKTDRTDQYYTGVVSRSQNISALLQTLELTGTVHFQIDNHAAKGKQGKIIVLP
ncbi:FecR family protein [Niastella caeni]|uniref:FecR family protein n=1 Tax=Niastella caeni TaxID=2569763 RepID=A0A4S8HDL1_9BACT|nr:FecR family protein [Niastella caeni]THU33027.1 FecR family protein [Niastella caeni]